MVTADRIAWYVRKLPKELQSEVLDFVSALLEKAGQEGVAESAEWSHLSLDSAMRGLETDNDPEYVESDLKEVFA